LTGYIIRRVLQALPVFFGTTLLIYFMVFAMPGDPIVAMFGDRGVNQAVYDPVGVYVVFAYSVNNFFVNSVIRSNNAIWNSNQIIIGVASSKKIH
jgi:ABC-type dipeptide/oligopeptide/nickel transport system permease component